VKQRLAPREGSLFEQRVLRRIFGPVREEITEGWIKLQKRSFTICTPHQSLLRCSNEGG
jgi:hypothetical protein